MMYYDSSIPDYKSGLLLLGGFSIFTSFCAISFQVLTVEDFVTEMLQTTEGISMMKNILIGIVIIQVVLTLILVFLRCILDISMVRLPEMNSNYEMAAYIVIPIIVLFGIQNVLYDSVSLNPTTLKILLIGVAGIYLAQWEKSR